MEVDDPARWSVCDASECDAWDRKTVCVCVCRASVSARERVCIGAKEGGAPEGRRVTGEVRKKQKVIVNRRTPDTKTDCKRQRKKEKRGRHTCERARGESSEVMFRKGETPGTHLERLRRTTGIEWPSERIHE